jgi:hypothetical protein
MYQHRKLNTFHEPPEFRTSFATHQSQFHIERLQRSPNIMVVADYVRIAVQEVITSFRDFAACTVPQRQVHLHSTH